jgi:flagellar hook-basal body complex protein FliE
MPIDPTQALRVGAGDFAVSGSDWRVPGIATSEAGLSDAAGAAEGSFGDALASSVDKLTGLQQQGAEAARALAEGTATDVSQVVMAVERARLSMQLAAQIRQKGVEAYQDIFHTQV